MTMKIRIRVASILPEMLVSQADDLNYMPTDKVASLLTCL